MTPLEMVSLERLGIIPGDDRRHVPVRRFSDIPAKDYFEEAGALLGKIKPHILEGVLPNLENFQGEWNPAGFMVYHLGVHERLGSLRFHVWPKGAVREEPVGPTIHDHAWHLMSTVVAGEYSDTLYEMEPVTSDPEISQNGIYMLFQTSRDSEARDVLSSDGTSARAIVTAHRIVTAGETHQIKAGVHHLTTIPKNQLTATLVFDSQALSPETHVYMQDQPDFIARFRQAVEPWRALFAKRQILHAI